MRCRNEEYLALRPRLLRAKRGFVARGASALLAALALAFGAMVAGASATSTTPTSAPSTSAGNAIHFSTYAESESFGYEPQAARSQVSRPFVENAAREAGGYFNSLLEDEVGLAAWQEYLHERALGEDNGNFLEQRKESLKRKLTSLYLSTTQQIVRAGEDFSRASGLVENINADFTPELGSTPWSLGVSAIGKIYEYNEKTRAVLWQLRGFGGAEERYGLNAGLLYRIATDDGALGGVNVFLDYEETDYGSFWRSSYGIEYRREFFDAFANYYLGITDPIRTNQIDILGDPRFAYTRDGVDVGVNFNVPQYDAGAGAKYYRFDGEMGQADDTGLRYNVNMRGGLLGYPQAKVYLAYDVPNEGDSTWGFGLNYTHRLGSAAQGKRAADSRTFDPYSYFYTPALREYSQRIALSGDAGGGVGYRIERRAAGVQFAVGEDDLEALDADFSRNIPLMSTIRIVTDGTGLADLATTRPDLWELQVFNNTDMTYEYEAGVIRLNTNQSGMRFLRDPASETPEVTEVQAGSLTIFLSGTDIEVQRTDQTRSVVGAGAVEVVSIFAAGGNITIQHAHVDEILDDGSVNFGDVINIIVDDSREKCRTINEQEMCFDEQATVMIFDEDDDVENTPDPTPPISFDGSPRILDEQQQALRTPTRIAPLTPAGAVITLTAEGGALRDNVALGYNITRENIEHPEFSLNHDGSGSSLAIINLRNLNSNTTDQYRTFTVVVDNVDQLGQVPTMLTIPFILEQTPSLRLTNPSNRELVVPFGRPANAIVTLAAAGGAGTDAGYSFSIVGSNQYFVLGNENGSNDTGSLLNLRNANDNPDDLERVTEVTIRIDSRQNAGEVADLEIVLTVTLERFIAEPLNWTDPGRQNISFAQAAGSVLVLQARGGAGAEIGYTFSIVDGDGNAYNHPTFNLANESGSPRDVNGMLRLRNPNTSTDTDTEVLVSIRISSTGFSNVAVPHIIRVVTLTLIAPPRLNFTDPGVQTIPFATEQGAVLTLAATGGASETSGYTFQIIDGSGSPITHPQFELGDAGGSLDDNSELRLRNQNTVSSDTPVVVTLEIDSKPYPAAVRNLTVEVTLNLQAPQPLVYEGDTRISVPYGTSGETQIETLVVSGGAGAAVGYTFVIDSQTPGGYFRLDDDSGSADDGGELVLINENDRAQGQPNLEVVVVVRADSKDFESSVTDLLITLTLTIEAFVPGVIVLDNGEDVSVDYGTAADSVLRTFTASESGADGAGFVFSFENGTPQYVRLATDGSTNDTNSQLQLIAANNTGFLNETITLRIANKRGADLGIADIVRQVQVSLEGPVRDGNPRFESPQNNASIPVSNDTANGDVVAELVATGGYPAAGDYRYTFAIVDAQGNPATSDYIGLANGNTRDNTANLILKAPYTGSQPSLVEEVYVQVGNDPASGTSPTRIRLQFIIEKTDNIIINQTWVRASFGAGEYVTKVEVVEGAPENYQPGEPRYRFVRQTIAAPLPLFTVSVVSGGGSGIVTRNLEVPAYIKTRPHILVITTTTHVGTGDDGSIVYGVETATTRYPGSFVVEYDRNQGVLANIIEDDGIIDGHIEFGSAGGSGIQPARLAVNLIIDKKIPVTKMEPAASVDGAIDISFFTGDGQLTLFEVEFDPIVGEVEASEPCDNNGNPCLVPGQAYEVSRSWSAPPPYWENCQEEDWGEPGGETSWLECTRNGLPNNADYCERTDNSSQPWRCYKYSGWDVVDINSNLPSYLQWTRPRDSGSPHNNYQTRTALNTYYLVYDSTRLSDSQTITDIISFRAGDGALATDLTLRIQAIVEGGEQFDFSIPPYTNIGDLSAAGLSFTNLVPDFAQELYTLTVRSDTILYDDVRLDATALDGTAISVRREVAANGEVLFIFSSDGNNVPVISGYDGQEEALVSLHLTKFNSGLTGVLPFIVGWQRATRVIIDAVPNLTLTTYSYGQQAGISGDSLYFNIPTAFRQHTAEPHNILTLTLQNIAAGTQRVWGVRDAPSWLSWDDGTNYTRGNNLLVFGYGGIRTQAGTHSFTITVRDASNQVNRSQVRVRAEVVHATRSTDRRRNRPYVEVTANGDGSTDNLFTVTIQGPNITNSNRWDFDTLSGNDGDSHSAFWFDKTQSTSNDRIFQFRFIDNNSIAPGLYRRTLVMENRKNNSPTRGDKLTLEIDVAVLNSQGNFGSNNPTLPDPTPPDNVDNPSQPTPPASSVTLLLDPPGDVQRFVFGIENRQIISTLTLWSSHDSKEAPGGATLNICGGIVATCRPNGYVDDGSPPPVVYAHLNTPADIYTVFVTNPSSEPVTASLANAAMILWQGTANPYSLFQINQHFEFIRRAALDRGNQQAFVLQYEGEDHTTNPFDTAETFPLALKFNTEEREARLHLHVRVRQGQVRIANQHELNGVLTGSGARDLLTLTISGGVPPYTFSSVDSNGHAQTPPQGLAFNLVFGTDNEYVMRLTQPSRYGNNLTMQLRVQSGEIIGNHPENFAPIYNREEVPVNLVFVGGGGDVVILAGSHENTNKGDRVLAASASSMQFRDVGAHVDGEPLRIANAPLASLEGVLYLLGGLPASNLAASDDNSNYLNQLLTSPDGVAWTKHENTSGSFAPHNSIGGDLLAHNADLIRIGGAYRGNGYDITDSMPYSRADRLATRQVWRSADAGSSWQVVGTLPEFVGVNEAFASPQAEAIRATEHNGNLYAFCPQCGTWQVAESTDGGATWSIHTASRYSVDGFEETALPLFNTRVGGDIISFGGTLYIVGGNEGGALWYDENASEWKTRDSGSARLDPGRNGAQAVVSGNTMYVIGGADRGLGCRIVQPRFWWEERQLVCEPDPTSSERGAKTESTTNGDTYTSIGTSTRHYNHYATPHTLQ